MDEPTDLTTVGTKALVDELRQRNGIKVFLQKEGGSMYLEIQRRNRDGNILEWYKQLDKCGRLTVLVIEGD